MESDQSNAPEKLNVEKYVKEQLEIIANAMPTMGTGDLIALLNFLRLVTVRAEDKLFHRQKDV